MPSEGSVMTWLNEEEANLVQQFRAFKAQSPLGLNFRAVTLTDEEESVLLAFRRFKIRIRGGFTSVFKWKTQGPVKKPTPLVQPVNGILIQ